MLEKQQKLFVQGYNLEVHDVIKYTQKHRATKCYRSLHNNYAFYRRAYMAKQLCDSNLADTV